MKITLYKSSLCPRCHLARRYLEQLRTNQPDLEVEYVDVLASPRRALGAGIRMIPALVSGPHTLSGIYLDKDAIGAFIDKMRLQSPADNSQRNSP